MAAINYDGNENQLPRSMYLTHSLKVTLEEMFNGTKRLIGVYTNVECRPCKGSGSKFPKVLRYDFCENCDGFGFKTTTVRVNADALEEEEQRTCVLCRGIGEAIIPEDRCLRCGGVGLVEHNNYLDVIVRRGVRHGQKIIYKDEGTQEPNRRPGNIYVIIEELCHQMFERNGDDLLMTMHLDLVESLCGFRKSITTIDNRKLSITSPRGKVIRNNDLKCIEGEGMPKYNNPNEKGRLIIKFEVNLPSSIKPALIPSIEQCLPPRPIVDVPRDAVTCFMVDMDFADDNDDNDQNISYEPEEYNLYEHYNQSYETQDHVNGSYQHCSDEQNDQQDLYQDENYDVHDNFERANQYNQENFYIQQSDSRDHYQPEQFYQQVDESESLESYDPTNPTQQYRYHNN